MTQFKDQAILVTGANGHLGRLAVEELLSRGATKVIAGTRDPSKLADLAARGVEVRRVDFADANLASAFTGADRLLIISTLDAERRAHQIAAVAAAKAAGVKHIVYTSAPNARPNADAGGIADHYWTEQAIAASGLDFTLLRNHLYAEVALMGLDHALASGQMFNATNGSGRNYVTRADTARTAAGALLSAEGQAMYDVTGPAPVTQVELAKLISDIAGKPLAAIGLTPAQLTEGLGAAGLPAFMVTLLVAFDTDAAAGFHAIVTDVVERFTGRKPQTLAAFLAENAAAIKA
jgi:NAD(P)H dehydrogenase (quinone)